MWMLVLEKKKVPAFDLSLERKNTKPSFIFIHSFSIPSVIQNVLVYRRTGAEVPMKAGRDVWWHEAMVRFLVFSLWNLLIFFAFQSPSYCLIFFIVSFLFCFALDVFPRRSNVRSARLSGWTRRTRCSSSTPRAPLASPKVSSD